MKYAPQAWNLTTIEKIISSGGSCVNLTIPDNLKLELLLKEKYLNAFEIPQSKILQLSCDTLRFVDQSSSLNGHFADPSFEKIYSWDMDGWQNGIKTGMYYLRRLPRGMAINFALVSRGQSEKEQKNDKEIIETRKEGATRGREPPVTSGFAGVVVCTDEICTSCQG